VQKYFAEFDKDANGHLDRKELREFLNKFFNSYKIHFPITDEYVDAVFREIDANRDNKIQPNELEAYAMHFVNNLLPQYEAALTTKQP
jgi:Ca2+-binding EF-hand superfamily protein